MACAHAIAMRRAGEPHVRFFRFGATLAFDIVKARAVDDKVPVSCLDRRSRALGDGPMAS